MREKRPRHILPLAAHDDRLHAPFDLANSRQSAAARAGFVRVERLGQIADSISNEWHTMIIQIGNHDLADFAGRRRFSVLQYLDDIALADDVMADVRFAFVGDTGEFARAIFVEY